jgi:hypothetical protein
VLDDEAIFDDDGLRPGGIEEILNPQQYQNSEIKNQNDKARWKNFKKTRAYCFQATSFLVF